MPELPNLKGYLVRASIQGWGEKIALFWTTELEAKELGKILSAILPGSIRCDVVTNPCEERSDA